MPLPCKKTAVGKMKEFVQPQVKDDYKRHISMQTLVLARIKKIYGFYVFLS